MLAPSINHYKGLNLQVKLPQDIFLSNYPSEIQNVAIDFGDGLGYRTVTYNQILNVNYTQANTYIWKYKLNLTNGQTLYSHSEVIIEEGLNTRPYGQFATKNSALDVYEKISVTASEAYYGKHATATLYIRDANDDGISNPLIVAEGFDTGAILNPEQEAGDNNIIGFLNNVNTSLSNLPAELNTYDIIYVDWDNGVDFIQRNAYALEEVIKWVNQEKAAAGSTEKNVIIGQSMGGLVARYALTDIEQNQNFNHDTDLYISHDAPHLGANTPIGMQHMYRHVNNMYQSAPLPLFLGEVVLPLAYDASGIFGDTVISVFGTDILYDLGEFVTPNQYLSISDFPASRQMLYNWVNMDYEIRNVIHDAWQQELSDMGYPQGYTGDPIRNIAIANGSECGVEYTHETSLIRYEKTAADKTALNSIIGLTDIGVGLSLIGTWQGTALIGFGILPGNSKYDIIFNASAMTNLNENKQIYYGRITYKKKILWFIPITVNLTREEKNQPNDILPYDSYGGGAYTIVNYSEDLFNTLPTLQNNGTFGRYGFIPTASALDAGKGTTNLDDMDYRSEYVGANPPSAPNDSPFDNFVTHFDRYSTSNTNSEHISFNRRNGNWLVAELTNNPDFTDCSFTCSDVNLFIPDDIVCSTTTYFFDDDINISNINITQGSSLVNIFGLNSNTLTISPNSLFGGGGLLAFNFTIGNDKCGSQTFYKTIWVGKPKNDLSLISSGGFTISLGNFYQITAMHDNNSNYTQANLSYEWEIPYAMIMFSNNNRSASIRPTRLGTYPYKVRARNLCGCSQWATQHFEVLSAPGPGDYYISPANRFGN
ncbi:PGAP1-like protein [Psychroflexus salarius]|uniref:PGAP1-like protein n=1 Tax=Psychroflexus salarius TaxID=1155689 RepID=A0A1M4W2P5_9FLAO|nr:hypothetical protein [Psychroflexus salarius]SHE75479.1 PGAP1-like protein [Psychroflexus salarius]